MGRWKATWSEAELEKLKALAGTMPMTMIAKELGRTTGAVLAKATEERLPVIVHIHSGRDLRIATTDTVTTRPATRPTRL